MNISKSMKEIPKEKMLQKKKKKKWLNSSRLCRNQLKSKEKLCKNFKNQVTKI